MKRISRLESTFHVCNYLLMGLFTLAVLIPLLYVVSTSLVSADELKLNSFTIIPLHPDFSSYKYIFNAAGIIINGYKITIFRVVVGTFLNLMFTSFIAYALAKKDLPGKNAITIYIFITMLFSGGMVPYYILIRLSGLMNNVWVYIIPTLVSVWNLLLLRTFFQSLPESMEEAAEIDGANQTQILFRIVLPLSVPALITVGLFYGVNHWNSWFDAQLFVNKQNLHPIQMVLKSVLQSAEISVDAFGKGFDIETLKRKTPSRSLQMATLVVSTLPIVIIYPFLQKYFIQGVMIGAIKG